MSSKNGRAELVSLLQYMKKSELDNPEILVRDERIMNLNRIVEEVKKSEEWEDVRMSIYSVGVEDGIERGEHQATLEMILRLLKEKEYQRLLKRKSVTRRIRNTCIVW